MAKKREPKDDMPLAAGKIHQVGWDIPREWAVYPTWMGYGGYHGEDIRACSREQMEEMFKEEIEEVEKHLANLRHQQVRFRLVVPKMRKGE